jgi:hypothetical protein
MTVMDESNDQKAARKARLQSEVDRRNARAAEKLRENLMRRKSQARARRAGDADMTDGLPAAKTDESPA